MDAALRSDDSIRFGQLNVDSIGVLRRPTTGDACTTCTTTRGRRQRNDDDDDDHKEERRRREKRTRETRVVVERRRRARERDGETDGKWSTRKTESWTMKTRILVLNREKAMLLANRSTIIREGTRAETGIERKRIERELVIPRGLAETDVDARETWLKLLRSPDASFVRFARAIRKREHEVTLKEKELEKLKGKEKLLRDRVVENEKELMHVKMKAERLESEARRDLEANSTPLREELERALRNEEETRRENARVKAELALVEGKVASAENEASLAKAKELAKEKECQMLADVVRDLSALGSRYRASDSDSSESDESGEEDDVYEDEDEESAGPK